MCILRMSCFIADPAPLTPEAARETAKLGEQIGGDFEDLTRENEKGQLQSWRQKAAHVAKMRERLLDDAKAMRVKLWRERVTASISNACRWIKGEQGQLTHLDTPTGVAIHPQDIADEVERRSVEQFAQIPDARRREQFMQEMAKHISKHHCELPAIDPMNLRKFRLRERDGAVGADGWHARELERLPLEAWSPLAEICAKAEEEGTWPKALVCGLTVVLRKPGPASKGVRLRLLRIMPRIMRGWASMRCNGVRAWADSWAPAELFGGIPGQGTDTASAPIALAMTKAIVKNGPMLGASQDYTACFDNIDPALAISVLGAHGLPKGLVRALRGLYKQLFCMCRVGQASTVEVEALMDIIQGCAWSCLMLNGLMATFVRAAKAELDKSYCVAHGVKFSIYLDDRSFMTKSASAARKILEHSAHYDYLINSTLNEQKCQVYHSPAVEPESIKDILPGAARTRRPWSLGFALLASGPAVDKNEEAGEDLNDRYFKAKAKATAERASVLPHDTRCVVLEACFPCQFSYGAEYEAPDGEQLAELSAAIIKSLWGAGRRSRSAAIL